MGRLRPLERSLERLYPCEVDSENFSCMVGVIVMFVDYNDLKVESGMIVCYL